MMTLKTFAAAIFVAFYTASCTMQTIGPSSSDYISVEHRIPILMNGYGVDGLALVVTKGDETVIAEGYGTTADGTPYEADTVCSLYSSTKVLSSFAVASLVEVGAFDIDAPLGDYLEDAPESWKSIPFWRLLNHTSGITMIVNKPIFEQIITDPDSTNEAIYRAVRDEPRDYRPGEFSRYRQSGYGIAEMIFEQALGADWPTIIGQRVTEPAGAKGTDYTAFATGERNGAVLSSAGGYQTTANDMGAIFSALSTGKIVSSEFLEELVYDERYDFDGYSLGSILETIGGVRTLGHRGGGARANIRYAPAQSVGVMACTDDTSNNELTVVLAAMLMREAALGERVLTPVAAPLLSMRDAPAAQILAFYEAAKSENPAEYDVSGVEPVLNSIGYRFLGDGQLDDAIAVFTMNVREFPNSANAHDSLGEALFTKGEFEQALNAYRKVLDLQPDNPHALSMVEKIIEAQK